MFGQSSGCGPDAAAATTPSSSTSSATVVAPLESSRPRAAPRTHCRPRRPSAARRDWPPPCDPPQSAPPAPRPSGRRSATRPTATRDGQLAHVHGLERPGRTQPRAVGCAAAARRRRAAAGAGNTVGVRAASASSSAHPSAPRPQSRWRPSIPRTRALGAVEVLERRPCRRERRAELVAEGAVEAHHLVADVDARRERVGGLDREGEARLGLPASIVLKKLLRSVSAAGVGATQARPSPAAPRSRRRLRRPLVRALERRREGGAEADAGAAAVGLPLGAAVGQRDRHPAVG